MLLYSPRYKCYHMYNYKCNCILLSMNQNSLLCIAPYMCQNKMNIQKNTRTNMLEHNLLYRYWNILLNIHYRMMMCSHYCNHQYIHFRKKMNSLKNNQNRMTRCN